MDAKQLLVDLGYTEQSCLDEIARIDALIKERAGKPYAHSIGGGKRMAWSVDEVKRLNEERDTWIARLATLRGDATGAWVPQVIT